MKHTQKWFVFLTMALLAALAVSALAQTEETNSTTAEPAPTAAKPGTGLSFYDTLPGMRPEKPSLDEEDPRLHRKVTMAMTDAPITDVLAKFTNLTAIKMTARRDIQDRKVTLIVRGVPVINAMAHIGLLMGWGWQRTMAGTDIMYRLQPQAGTRWDAQSMRDNVVNSSITQKATEEWQKMQPVLKVWVDSGGDIDAIRDVDPDMAQRILRDPMLEYRLYELASMHPAARLSWFISQIREAEEVRGPGVSYTIVEQQLAARRSTGGSRDPAFTQKVDVSISGTSFPDALKAISKVTHLNVVADSYSRKTSVSSKDWQETPVNDILNAVADQAGYDWTQSGNFVRFRSRTWFLDELRDIPERLLKPFKDLKEKQGRLMFQDYAALVATLSDDQLDALAKAGSENSLAADASLALRYLPQLKFYSSLSTSQRTAAWGEHGLTMAEMSSAQKQSFVSLMARDRRLAPPYWEQAILFYIRQRGSQGYQIVFMFDVEQSMAWEQRLTLPQGSAPESNTGAADSPATAGDEQTTTTPPEEDSGRSQSDTQY